MPKLPGSPTILPVRSAALTRSHAAPHPGKTACYHSRVIIPHDQLAPDTLRAVIEEFATRDGTELTDADVKIEQILRGLRSGKLAVTWDEESASCNIVAVRDLPPSEVDAES